MTMSVEQSVECLAKQTELLGENVTQCHFVCHKSHGTLLNSNPGRRGGSRWLHNSHFSRGCRGRGGSGKLRGHDAIRTITLLSSLRCYRQPASQPAGLSRCQAPIWGAWADVQLRAAGRGPARPMTKCYVPVSRLPQRGGPGPHVDVQQDQGGQVTPPHPRFPSYHLLGLLGLRWKNDQQL
jgi:hypothetical protein